MKKTWFGLKIKWWMWRGWVWGVWEREKWVSIERDQRKWEKIALKHIYRSLVIIDRSRGTERCRALKGLIDAAIEQVSKGVHNKKKLDGSRNYQEAIEETKTFSMDRGAIKKLSRLW